MIIFTHIAKTSGTSFSAAIRHNFSSPLEFEELETISSQLGKPITDVFESGAKLDVQPDFVHSHLPYGFHSVFNEENPQYIVMLRDPIDRCFSSLRHSMKIRSIGGLVGDNTLVQLASRADSSKILLAKMRDNNINCNVMTQQLSGLNYTDLNVSDGMRVQAQYYMPYCHPSRSYSASKWEKMLDAAKSNLDKYAFVGFQDDFRGSVNRFCEQFGLTSKAVSKKHKSIPQRMFDLNLDDSEVQGILADMNAYDIQLYEYALSRR